MRLFFVLLLFSSFCYSQEQIACEDAIKKIEDNGNLTDTLKDVQIILDAVYKSVSGDIWLKEVKCYEINNTNFVVAEIYSDNLKLFTKKYLFCGIPKENWEHFYNETVLSSNKESYGKKFHKYIIDFKCNCKG